MRISPKFASVTALPESAHAEQQHYFGPRGNGVSPVATQRSPFHPSTMPAPRSTTSFTLGSFHFDLFLFRGVDNAIVFSKACRVLPRQRSCKYRW